MDRRDESSSLTKNNNIFSWRTNKNIIGLTECHFLFNEKFRRISASCGTTCCALWRGIVLILLKKQMWPEFVCVEEEGTPISSKIKNNSHLKINRTLVKYIFKIYLFFCTCKFSFALHWGFISFNLFYQILIMSKYIFLIYFDVWNYSSS